jgi:hypothetical protein
MQLHSLQYNKMTYCKECGAETELGHVLCTHCEDYNDWALNAVMESIRDYKSIKFVFTWFKWGTWSVKDIWFIRTTKLHRATHGEVLLWVLNIGPLQIERFRC